MKRRQFSNHNGTYKSFVWSSINLNKSLNFENWLFFIVLKTGVSLQKWSFLLQEKIRRINTNKHYSEKRQYLPYFWSENGFKGTVVNLALPSLHGGSLEITRTIVVNILQLKRHKEYRWQQIVYLGRCRAWGTVQYLGSIVRLNQFKSMK